MLLGVTYLASHPKVTFAQMISFLGYLKSVLVSCLQMHQNSGLTQVTPQAHIGADEYHRDFNEVGI